MLSTSAPPFLNSPGQKQEATRIPDLGHSGRRRSSQGLSYGSLPEWLPKQ